MSPSPFSSFIRILARACIVLPVVAVLAVTTVSASAATLNGTYDRGTMAAAVAADNTTASALFTEGTAPTIASGGTGTVPMSLTLPDGVTAVPNMTGDVITFTPPSNTTLSFSSGSPPGCPGGYTGPTSITGGSWTCTARTTSPWPVTQPFLLKVGSTTPGGTYTGGSVTLTRAGAVLATLPITYTVSPSAQITQPSLAAITSGAVGTATMALTQVDGTTAVPYKAGDVISVTAPANTTITGLPSCPGTVAIATGGTSATCTATSTGTWNTTQPVTLQVNPGTSGGTYTGSMTLTAAGITTVSNPINVNVRSTVQIAQTSVPTFTAGSTGNSVPMTMTQANSSAAVYGATNDVITVNAPPNTKVTAFTCGASTTQVFAANGTSGTCTSDASGAWTYTSRPITLSVNAGTPAGTYTGSMTYSDPNGNVIASSPVTIIVPGIHIVKTSSPAAPGPVSSGQVITYTLTLTNQGSSPITGANVTDNLSNVIASTSNPASITASAGSATFTTPKLTWTGTLPANNVPVTITYQVTVN